LGKSNQSAPIRTNSNTKFSFRKNDSIGAADAAEDEQFLRECFVDTGDYDSLLDVDNPRRIILGRTGSGKTALIQRISQDAERSISIQPESLALAYISNSTILQFVLALGVKLDIFFRLLWRHVFVVEILKAHYNIVSESSKRSFLDKISGLFRDKKNEQALHYLEKWGKSFWEETEYRTKEVTTKLEADLKASIGTAVPAPFNLEAAKSLSEEKKQEVIQRAQRVVNEVQIRELSTILDFLGDVLNEGQKVYYILIDRLDENWIEDRLRLLLIRALIETARDFKKLQRIKIVFALRYDLIDRVFRLTRDSGFQEEKYTDLFLELRWTEDQLVELIDKRINHLLRQRYVKQAITHKDLLPNLINKQPTIKYLLDRTQKRPRELIHLVNLCIHHAMNKHNLTPQIIKEAEGDFSRARLRFLADEWHADYPTLLDVILGILKNRQSQFRANEIGQAELEELSLTLLGKDPDGMEEFANSARKVIESHLAIDDFRRLLIQTFYKIGLVVIGSPNFPPSRMLVCGRI
jgi:hypothetical protein